MKARVAKAKRSLIERGQKEKLARLPYRIYRDKSKELYYCHTGDSSGSSWRTILASRSQLKLTCLGVSWYFFQTFVYMLLANLLIYVTFQLVPPNSPSYPGAHAANGTNPYYHMELFDSGFHMTPDLGYRPFWLKKIFVDMMVTISQTIPPLILFSAGHTREFICYVGLIGTENILKGVIQLATILPAANTGEGCWKINFPPEEITIIREEGYAAWFYQNWGMTHGCNDMLWSGHTSQSSLGLLFLDKSLRHLGVPKFIRGVLVVYFIVYIWAVLACRMHYSIDVIVAAGVSLSLYTHSPLRFSIWCFANHVVGNDPFSDQADSESSGSESDVGEKDAFLEDANAPE